MTQKNVIRRKLIIGNWKMNKSLREGREDFLATRDLTKEGFDGLDIGIAAPSLMIPELASRRKSLGLYAQNSHWAQSGAFTGETSGALLKELSVNGSLVAHSERRSMNGETHRSAGLRMAALLNQGLECIFCVGETLEEREKGLLKKVLADQWFQALEASSFPIRSETAVGADASRPLLSLAYEPVWAIGTGKAATPLEAEEAHGFLRGLLEQTWGNAVAQRLRILYGGSVTTSNAQSFFSAPNVDGALVGGASLKPLDFVDLCRAGL